MVGSRGLTLIRNENYTSETFASSKFGERLAKLIFECIIGRRITIERSINFSECNFIMNYLIVQIYNEDELSFHTSIKKEIGFLIQCFSFTHLVTRLIIEEIPAVIISSFTISYIMSHLDWSYVDCNCKQFVFRVFSQWIASIAIK